MVKTCFITSFEKMIYFQFFRSWLLHLITWKKNTFSGVSPGEFDRGMLSLRLKSSGHSSNALQLCDPRRQKFHLKKMSDKRKWKFAKKMSGPGGLCPPARVYSNCDCCCGCISVDNWIRLKVKLWFWLLLF